MVCTVYFTCLCFSGPFSPPNNTHSDPDEVKLMCRVRCDIVLIDLKVSEMSSTHDLTLTQKAEMICGHYFTRQHFLGWIFTSQQHTSWSDQVKYVKLGGPKCSYRAKSVRNECYVRFQPHVERLRYSTLHPLYLVFAHSENLNNRELHYGPRKQNSILNFQNQPRR